MRYSRIFWTVLAAATLSGSLKAQERPDIVLADFEGPTYGAWTATGEAFGSGPARGTLPNQNEVGGYTGQGLVNSYLRGDGTTGALTSPEFKIERRYLNFLLGGGSHPGECCLNLQIDGSVVLSATGRDNEWLDWRSWDLQAWQGKTARIQIVDTHTGGWGHINADEITLSDQRKAPVVKVSPLYSETYRPQVHFSAQKGWINDPNGLVYFAGEYHLFFQHNPFGVQWGNMTWGHAVSPDLLHWRQLPNALEPDRLGTMFSGSAVVDWNNTSGFQKGDQKPLVAIYTAAGGTSPESKGQPFTQCIAYSVDKGRTWTKFPGNPVLPHVAGENRDPKVVWHAPTRRWIMALYLDRNDFGLFRSSDLKSWDQIQLLTMPECSECPDFFEVPVAGRPAVHKWVFMAANGRYLVGDFDGQRFTPEPGAPRQVEFGANCYAVQTYSDIPPADGRRILMAWMNGGSYPDMPFNQQMATPCELTLHQTPPGLRLFKRPIRELAALRFNRAAASREISDTAPIHLPDRTLPCEIEAEFDPGSAGEVVIDVLGQPVVYRRSDQTVHALGRSAPLPAENGRIRLRIVADRTSLELFGNDGRAALTSCYVPELSVLEKPGTVKALASRGASRMKITVYSLRSVWPAAAEPLASARKQE